MKLLVADDHTLFRDALVQYIKREFDDCEITVTKDFDDAYEEIIQDQSFALVILDYRMPGMNGLRGFEKIRQEFPDIKVALMSGVAEPDDVSAVMGLGACAYFPKTLSGQKLVEAIEDVVNGDKFIPTQELSDNVVPSYYADTNWKNNERRHRNNGNIPLTPREKEVLSHLAQGQTNKEIANALALQVVTVKLHIRGICRKLNANNRTQAALKATELGLVSV